MISIISCIWNRAEQTKNGIMSILAQDLPKDVEIILVDDGSTDNIKDVCQLLAKTGEEKGVTVKSIHTGYEEARISSIPRNIGAKQAKGDILIFTEPEILHVGNTIAQIVGKIDNCVPIATQIWTMGQRIYKELNEKGTLEYPARLLSHQYAMLVEGNMQNTNAPDSDWGITGSNNCWAGCLFGMKKEWFNALGGFDEDFEGHGREDWDLFDRFNLYGKPAKGFNDIVVIHQWHEKNYPYNIYDMADKNGKKSQERIKRGEYKANV